MDDLNDFLKIQTDYFENQPNQQGLRDPFGSPDASRANSVEDTDKVGSKGFVKMNAKNSGISNYGSEHFRVIVGKKGSGKTLYLRRYFLNLRRENSIFTENFEIVIENLEQLRPQTDHILKFSQLFNGEFLTEKWRILWRMAIIRTVVIHIFHNAKLADFKKKLPSDFKKKYKSILSKAERPIPIFSQVIEIINNIQDAKDFNKLSSSILWYELDVDLGEIIKNGVPLFFFVDAIDEEYQHAPTYWLRAQKGLFYTLMQFLRDTAIGGKLHILISIRDNVYSSILNSEHETRYLDSSYVTILHWNTESAKYLLLEKLRHLEPIYFIKKGKDLEENWLGLRAIRNTKRNVEENVLDYIVRHTRCIPRDIVILGNALSNRVRNLKETTNDFTNFEKDIVKIVHHFAKRFAQEQIQISANHLTANLMPSQAFELGIHKMYTSAYSGDQEYLNLSNIFLDKIREIFSHIGKDRFSNEELKEARRFTKEVFEIDSDLNFFDILWQNGLLGYDVDEVYTKFFSENTTEFKLPFDKENYSFHSILIDYYQLSAIGNPVKMKTFETK
ncbi:MAG: hypothetical protein KF870_15985 [Leadbetterella sp.]|nr:hypothetical protein [Leadbetterella sp.]